MADLLALLDNPRMTALQIKWDGEWATIDTPTLGLLRSLRSRIAEAELERDLAKEEVNTYYDKLQASDDEWAAALKRADAAEHERDQMRLRLAAAESIHEFIADMPDGSQQAAVDARARYRATWEDK